MKVIAAYLLAALRGNTTPSAKDIKSILESGRRGRIEFLLSELKGKDLAEVIACGREKFVSVPSSGGVTIAAAAPAAGGDAAVPAAAETKKEEKEKSDDLSPFSISFGLFYSVFAHKRCEYVLDCPFKFGKFVLG
ncbi:60S acidic ribosomal protein P2 [Rhynchospora pubera]|uniref:60S acidic ribosomal protein P2 n=1 Tax=Rhynchospora pubera TaxID=906938 RepID=A0AAV8CES3_9POAL|nr:60S acidic ribosomal protein P2 [Rhynchospora pubera]